MRSRYIYVEQILRIIHFPLCFSIDCLSSTASSLHGAEKTTADGYRSARWRLLAACLDPRTAYKGLSAMGALTRYLWQRTAGTLRERRRLPHPVQASFFFCFSGSGNRVSTSERENAWHQEETGELYGEGWVHSRDQPRSWRREREEKHEQ